ncbi:low-specificity L-threonine aldolase [Burkholderia multivorans]|uniref:low-specificity L-threonine aldolase n=1 Tax=Burkholderia multivorans TaxID=87883 RepID=UPI001C249052|nr:low-specificity L-threonine aldolase [Burkholderia multivorans]MBU9477034.1 low-specificity L-threonine aldolase [Burkholderia multivorans]
MQWMDMRSDTVTHPTPAMRQAMVTAAVGDDVYGDDPTVAELEALAAELLGKDAALFVPSGTFGNQLAIFSHCQRGNEVILGDDTHLVWHENGAAAVIAGVQLRTIASDKGVVDPEEIEARIRVGSDIHIPKTGLICIENAHSNGRVIPLDIMQRTAELARRHAVPVHLDGARVFNAATYLGCDVRDITCHADTVMCCLSKGLAAPVGSILAGPEDFIVRARYNRKLLGGGLRQAGVLAAPGIIALTEMTQRLGEDHANARYMAERLNAIPGIEVDVNDVHINMVWFRLPSAIDTSELVAALAAVGIRASQPYGGRVRLMTHWQINRKAIDVAVEVIQKTLSK